MDIAKDLFYAQQTLFSLFSVTNKLQIQGDKQLGDMTLRQVLGIPSLFHAPDGRATINHIARSMGTSKQNAKQIVDTLVKKGYLSVMKSDQDKRAVNVTITPEGQQAFQLCSERTDIFLAAMFNGFTAQELETLCGLLQKLYRFDGAPQGEFDHIRYHANDAATILQHHPSFAKRRAASAEKESK